MLTTIPQKNEEEFRILQKQEEIEAKNNPDLSSPLKPLSELSKVAMNYKEKLKLFEKLNSLEITIFLPEIYNI